MNHINIYDFDGVIADPIEDCVFRIESSPLDAEFIQLGRDRYGITYLSNHTGRNRHLILQEVLYERKIPCSHGPITCSADPFFVLTARSGPGAVARVSQFFEHQKIRPEEMFFVGPVSKTHILIDLATKFEDYKLTFWDDSIGHIEDCIGLGFGNLEAKWVDNKVPSLMKMAENFYAEQFAWLKWNQH